LGGLNPDTINKRSMSNKNVKRILITAVIIGFIAVFKIFGLGQYLTLSYIKASQAKFEVLYAEHNVLVIAAYVTIYIFVTTLSLPGATVMTLAGGALFGLMVGAIVVSFASTIGTTLACLVARFILRDWIQNKFGDKLKAINKGIEREGIFYLFTLRLIPVFPFWAHKPGHGTHEDTTANILLGIAAGMLPATIIYVNAGKELVRIDSLSGILSPGLIFSLALLGLFPIATKKLLTLYRTKRGGQDGELRL
jgi:uncharacterized membrane protein YdjX (TVP38/TMEM64 family)